MSVAAQSSYKIHQFATSANNEVQRLGAQVELFWKKELRCLKQFGLRDGMRVLECGSGPGYLLKKLLDEFPTLRATGVEIDPFLVEKSKDALAPFGDRHHVVEGSILSIPFEDQSFDFVVARLVLEHLSDPVAAAREMRRVLKPGGKVVVIDNDFDLHLRSYPEIPELRELYEAYCACRVSQGGNPRIGRQLPVTLEEAGFENVDLEIVVAHNKVVGDHAFLRSEGSGIPAQLVKDGFLSPDVLDRLTEHWHKALQQEDHSLVRQLYVAVGERGTNEAVNRAATGRSQDELASARGRGVRGRAEAAGIVTSVPDVENTLRKIWLQVLGIAEVGLDDNFFDIGGDSIYLVDVVELAKDYGLDFTPVTVFEHPTVRSLAKHLAGDKASVGALDKIRERAERQRQALGLGAHAHPTGSK